MILEALIITARELAVGPSLAVFIAAVIWREACRERDLPETERSGPSDLGRPGLRHAHHTRGHHIHGQANQPGGLPDGRRRD